MLATVLAAIALRAAAMTFGSGQFEDPDNYLTLARSLAAGEGLSLRGHPTAYRPPLYPIVLMPFVLLLGDGAISGIAILHLGLGAATVGLTAFVGRRWGLSCRRALLAAFIVALDPVLVWQSRFVMTETLSAFLLTAVLAGLTVPGWLGAMFGGLLFGLSALARPSTLPGAALTIVAALWLHPGSRRERFAHSLILALSLGTALVPWMVRNALVFGVPVWTTTHGGYTLALANNQVYYRDVLDGPPGRVWTGHDQWLWWDSVNRATAGMTEPQADQFLRDGVIRLARSQPQEFIRASWQRLERFWSVSPALAVYAPAVRWVTALWTIPLWLALILGLSRQYIWSWSRIAAPLSVIGLTLVHSLYWTDLRMRAPIVPAIALIAAGAALPVIFRSQREAATAQTEAVRHRDP
jgi:4-amino-4-deoxy-L-arabinose transferase-like glycosyltransferase